MLLLSIAVIPVLAISLSQSHLSAAAKSRLDAVDYTIWALFVLEYLVLLVLAPSRPAYLKSPRPGVGAGFAALPETPTNRAFRPSPQDAAPRPSGSDGW
jgi:hypothetical protein